MIKKEYPANTPKNKKLSQPAKRRIYSQNKKHYASSPITKVEFFQTTYTSSNRPPPNPFAKLQVSPVAAIYRLRFLMERFTVRCLFSLRTDTGKQIITFFFNLHKLCGTSSGVVHAVHTLQIVNVTATIKSTSDNSNLQGKSLKVRLIGSSSFQELEANSRK